MSSVPFPRGTGGNDEASASTKRPRTEEDSIFGLKRTRRIEIVKAKGTKKKTGNVTAAALLRSPLAGAIGLGMTRSSGNSKALKIDNVSFTKYTPGTLALGFILQIMDNFVVVSLPGGVTGTVAMSELSDAMHRLSAEASAPVAGSKKLSSAQIISSLISIRALVATMQPVRCYVLEIIEKSDTKKKSLVLSMRSSLVNRGLAIKHMIPGFPISGCISSKEDHGYVVSAGVNAVTFFLPFKAVPLALSLEASASAETAGTPSSAPAASASALPGSHLPIGQPIECIVEAVNETARSVTLRAQRKATSEAITKGELLPFNALCPGMKFLVTVDKIAQNGLLVKFLNDFHGVIDSFSLPRPMSAKEWQVSMGSEDDEKDVAAVHEARIVYVDHGARSVRLSMRPHVLDFRGPHGLPPLGSVLQGLRIKFAAKKQGVLLSQGDVEATDATLAMSIVSRVGEKQGEGKVKGAARLDKKMMAADAKRRKEINESVIGVFIHKSSLAERRADATDEDVASDGKEKEEEKAKGKGKSLPVSEADLEKRYKVGEQVQVVKVIGYHLAEGFAVGTNMETAISSEVLHWSKISGGQVLTATIAAIRDFGLLIKISANVQAVCPLLHLSDTGLTLTTVQLNKKFKVGQTHKVRVWEADGNAILVTMKKSIVDDKSVPILSYAEATPERVSLGVVSRADEKGLKVNFFNGVKGVVPMSILARQGVADAADSYRAGQVVKCLVLKRTEPKDQSSKSSKAPAVPKVTLALAVGSCDAAEIKSLLAALVPEGESKPDAANKSAANAVDGDAAVTSGDAATDIVQKKAVGEFVSGIVYKVDTESISVRLSDGRLGTMLKHQAADFAATTDIYFGVSSSAAKKASYFSIGSKIVNALVLSTNKKVLALSMKPLLLAAASEKAESAAETLSVPNNVADLVPGQVVAGFIFKVESYGVMVRFREGLTALVPRPNVADRFLATPEGLFNVGDSVRCVIQRVDLARERVIATFKSGVVGPSRGSSSFLKALLRESCLAATFLAVSESKLLPAWDKIPLFTVVSATVSSIESYGVVLTAADQTTTMLARGVHSKTAVTVGQTASVLVLDVDFKNKVLDVTMDSDLIKGVTVKGANGSKANKKKSALGGEAALRVKGSVLKGRVELVQAEGRYLVVSIDKCALAYVALADYHCPIITAPSDYEEHQEVSVKVETPSSSGEAGESPHQNCAILSIFTGTSKDQAASVSSSSEDRKSVDAAALKKKFLDTIRLGAVLKWRVVAVTSVEVTVKPDYVEAMGLSVKASVHITGTVDQTAGTDDLVKVLTSNTGVERDQELGPNHPFFGISIGSRLLGRVQQIRHHIAVEPEAETDSLKKKAASKADAEDKIVICLSTVGLERGLKFDAAKGEEALQGKRKREGEDEKAHPLLQLYGKNAIKERGVYAGCITKIDDTGCYVAFSPFISCRLHFMDVSKDEEVVRMFMQKAIVGQRVLAQVTSFSYDAKAAGKSKPKGAFISRATVENLIKGGGDSLSAVCAAAIATPSSATVEITSGLRTFGILDLRSHRHRYQIPRPPAFQVYLGEGRVGRVCVTELSDPSSWKDCAYLMGAPSSSSKALPQLPNGGKHGDLVHCRVLAVNGKSNTGSSDMIEVSLRPSRLDCKNKKEAIKPDLIPSDGSVIQAFVANYSTKGKGCFLRVSHGMTGQVLMRDLDDEFLTDPQSLFPMGRLVSARVLSASQTEGTAKLSLKQSVIVGDKKAEEEIKGITVRSTIEGTVQRVTPIGVFVCIKGTSLVGLCRRGAACEDSEELADLYEAGAFVRAKVLGVNRNSKKVALGLKPSFFAKEDKNGGTAGDDSGDEDSDDEDEDEESEDNSAGDDDCVVMLNSEDDGSDDEMDAMIKAASVRPVEDEDEEQEERPPSSKKQKTAQAISKEVVIVDLQEEEEEDSDDDDDDAGPSIFAPTRALKAGSSSGIQWGDFKPKETASAPAASAADESEDDSEGEEAGPEEKSKGSRTRQREVLKRKEEEAIRARESSLEAGNSLPERPEDFERLLLAEPSSSLLWIKYMSHYLSQADLDATRQIAEKALRTIHFKEEEEKMNVWIAYVNMEHKYGNMTSLDAVFKRAVAESKGKLVHLNLAEAYESAKDLAGATAMLEKALKKYKTSKKVWMAFQHFKLRSGDSEGAKALLGRSMQSLSRHKHIEVLIKYAVCEFDVGSEDRGRSVFEELVGSYPKRTDLWHVYVDKEVKSGNHLQARQLFERMVASRSSAKAMKAAFKKFLSFEQLHGSPEQQEAVKTKAREYVSSIM